MRSPCFPRLWPRPDGRIAAERFAPDTPLRISV
jgi:hypothetical protein